MASGITYLRKLTTYSFSLPFLLSDYHLSFGFWVRWTKDVVVQPKLETNQDVSLYQYTPIPAKRFTRVLELHPEAGDEPLCEILLDVSLDDSSLEFEALSYVWGMAGIEDKKDIIDLGGGQCLELLPTPCITSVTQPTRGSCGSTPSASTRGTTRKKACRYHSWPKYTHVAPPSLIWLGLPGPQSKLGLEILAFLATSDERIGSGNAPWVQLPGIEVGAALRDILGRQDFERLWVVQEAALATHITMQVGRTAIEWSRLARTRRFLARIKMTELSPSWQESEEPCRIDFRPVRELLEQSLAAEAKRNGTVEVPTLLDVVHSIRHRKVVDPRDRMYGVMSLVTPAEVAGFVPDYKLTWEETYRRFYDLVERQVSKDSEITLEDIMPQNEAEKL